MLSTFIGFDDNNKYILESKQNTRNFVLTASFYITVIYSQTLMACSLDQSLFRLQHGFTVHQKEAMKYEALRLSTYSKYPPSVEQSSLVLANAGFFYIGKGDEVECFSCGLKVKKPVWLNQKSVHTLC